MLKIATFALLTTMAAVANGSDWEVKKEVEPISDAVFFGAVSGAAEPIERPDFPLSEILAQMRFVCEKGRDFSAIKILLSQRITPKGNPQNTHHYNHYMARVRWDKEPGTSEKVEFKGVAATEHYLGLHTVDKVKKHKTLLFEINPYGHSRIIFKFDLIGAAKAINEAQALCRET